jgi:hypothetical protein
MESISNAGCFTVPSTHAREESKVIKMMTSSIYCDDED